MLDWKTVSGGLDLDTKWYIPPKGETGGRYEDSIIDYGKKPKEEFKADSAEKSNKYHGGEPDTINNKTSPELILNPVNKKKKIKIDKIKKAFSTFRTLIVIVIICMVIIFFIVIFARDKLDIIVEITD